MITVTEAIETIQRVTEPLGKVVMKTIDAIDHVLCNSIVSPINMPPFDQSAMDGYALNGTFDSYDLVAEIKAGDSTIDDSGVALKLQPGQAARIFTGAMVPLGTTAIAKQEIVNRGDKQIKLLEPVKDKANIRPKGEQIKKGDLALEKNTVITAGVAGFLYGLGIDSVIVFRKPTVCIIATGNELVTPGLPLPLGKIYESNSYTLIAAFKKLGISVNIEQVSDDYEATKNCIQKALDTYDVLITTGGISVGDYDFVGKAFDEVGVTTEFYKVKQKPGKPLFFGRYKNKTLIYGLPGNPAAALTCFYMYVIPGVKTLMGNANSTLEVRRLKLTKDYKKSVNLSHILKARQNGNSVEILNAQSSAMLSSFAFTNCLAFLQDGRETWLSGDEVDVFMLPI